MTLPEIRLALQNRRDADLRNAEAADAAAKLFMERAENLDLNVDARNQATMFATEYHNRSKRGLRNAQVLTAALAYIPELEAAGD